MSTLSTAAKGALAALALALASCGGSDGGPLDASLRALLDEVGGPQGMAAFRMPASDDLARIPQDPRNPLTAEKVALGRLLYHETALLVSPLHAGGVGCASCASCHHAAAGFQAGVIQGIGDGGSGFGVAGEGRVSDPAYAEADLDVQPIRSPSAMNGAYQPVMLWNGQFGGSPGGPNAGTEAAWTAGTPKETNELGYEGLETQAIAGLKVHRLSPIEATIAVTNAEYVALFAAAFPTGLPLGAEYGLREQAGLAIAAYERTLLANEAPFQRWLRGDEGAMTDAQKRGAIAFFGAGGCVRCHTGPALSSMAFHALGMPDLPEGTPGVHGKVAGRPETRGRGGFTGAAADDYKYKVPQLYNLADVGFFGHGGTFRTVREVVQYHLDGVPANPAVPSSQLAAEFAPIPLPPEVVDDLVAFLEEGLRDPDLARYVPDALPSGNCTPNNDPQTRDDLDFP